MNDKNDNENVVNFKKDKIIIGKYAIPEFGHIRDEHITSRGRLRRETNNAQTTSAGQTLRMCKMLRGYRSLLSPRTDGTVDEGIGWIK